MNKITLIIAGTLLGLASSLSAQAIEEKNVTSGKVQLDPAKGYIFLTSPVRTNGMFVRVPDADDYAEYRADWEKAFAKAEKSYASAMANWKKDVEIAKAQDKKPRPEPVKPTRETFSIGPIELRTTVSFGPTFVYNKSKAPESYSYLNAVKPGTYIYYGPVFAGPNGFAGYCYCMGSVKFEVKAGVVTDLGTVLAQVVGLEGLMGFDKVDNQPGRFTDGNPAATAVGPDQSQYGVPGSLGALPTVQAELHAAGKMNNFLGIRVARAAPVPGVLAYQRDTVIDLRTGQPIPVAVLPFTPVDPADSIPDEE